MVRVTFFLLLCRECYGEDPIPFGSAEERGRWASEHRNATGHDKWFVKDVAEASA